MMPRIRTPFFARNPYYMSDQSWGWTYVLHGLTGIALVGLVIAHVYFAVRPDKWWMTKSMLVGLGHPPAVSAAPRAEPLEDDEGLELRLSAPMR